MSDQTTVLIVDDDIDFIAQQQMQLEDAGYRVLTANTMKQAENVLDAERPDIAILDLMMEEADAGFNLSYHVKKKDATIPVILVTAVTAETGLSFDASTDEERSWVKADAFLSKPIRFEQLRKEVERLLADR